MAQYISKEKRGEIFKEYGGKESNTGSVDGQIALFTYRIQGLSEHLKRNKNDHSSRRALLALVGKRKRLLQYLERKDIQRYRDLADKLGLRR